MEAFRRKGRLYLVFEYVGRNLLEELEQHPRGLAPELVRRYTYMLSRALHSCHSERIIHRDIKPENLLINGRERTLKLCDFGFARMTGSAGGAGGSSSGPYTDYVATRWYRSPELLLGTTRYDGKVDLWAIGCILSEMADGQALFPGESEVDQLHLIQRTMGNLSPAQVSAFNANPRFSAYTLPKVTHLQTLEKRHSGRLIRKCIHLMKGLLHTCPDKRLTSLEAMRHPWFEGLHDPQNEIAPKTLPSDEPSPATTTTPTPAPTPAPAPAAAATAAATATAKADTHPVATTPPPPPSPPPPPPPQPQPQLQTQAQPSCTTRTTTTTTTTTTTVVFGPGTALPTRALPKPSLCGLLADRHGLTQRSTPAGGPDATAGGKAAYLARPLADVNPLWRQSKRLPLARPSHTRGGPGAEPLGNEWAPGSDLVRAGFNDRPCSLHFALSHGDRVPEGGGHPVPLHTAFAAARKTGKQLPRLSSAESRNNGGVLGAGRTPCPATIPVLSSARQSRQQSAGKQSRSRSGSKVAVGVLVT